MPKTAIFRFYEELNNFLDKKNRKKELEYIFYGTQKVKDAIESFGIPHTEVDMIIANNESVDFDHVLKNNDRIAVYPKFESLDVSSVSKLRNSPLREIQFILDVHLGKLARYLRLIGFDCYYHNELTDKNIAEISLNEKRIILTRDKGILKYNHVTHGYFLRSDNPREQLKEVIKRFDLKNSIKMFTRCMECNGELTNIPKEKIINELLDGTKNHYDHFFMCNNCSKIYWRGSHYKKMKSFINTVLSEL
jgi:uncharacterized protein with PIN domain